MKNSKKTYPGIFYRLAELGKYISKAPLYINPQNWTALETCIRNIQTEYDFLKSLLKLQNIKDWKKIQDMIEMAMEQDANHSNKFMIIGELHIKQDENGNEFRDTEVHDLKILP